MTTTQMAEMLRRFPFVFVRYPIDRLGQRLDFVYNAGSSPFGNDRLTHGVVDLFQEAEKVERDLVAIVGTAHWRPLIESA